MSAPSQNDNRTEGIHELGGLISRDPRLNPGSLQGASLGRGYPSTRPAGFPPPPPPPPPGSPPLSMASGPPPQAKETLQRGETASRVVPLIRRGSRVTQILARYTSQDPELQVTSTAATSTQVPSTQAPYTQTPSTQQALAPPSSALQLSEAQVIQTGENRQQENISKRTKRMAKAVKRTSAEMKRAWQQGQLAATKTASAEEAAKEIKKLAKTVKKITTSEAAREAVELTERAVQTNRAAEEAATQTAAANQKAAEAAEKAVQRAKRARTLIKVRSSEEEAGRAEAKAEEAAAAEARAATAAAKARELARTARQVADAARKAADQATESSQTSQSSRSSGSSGKSTSSGSSGRGTGNGASGAAQLRLVPTHTTQGNISNPASTISRAGAMHQPVQDTGAGPSEIRRLGNLTQPEGGNLGLTHLRTASPRLSNRSGVAVSGRGDDVVPMENTPRSHRAHDSPTSSTGNRSWSLRAGSSPSAQVPPRPTRDSDARSGEGSRARPTTRRKLAIPAESVQDTRQASKRASGDSRRAVSKARKRGASPVSNAEGPSTEEATGLQDSTGGRRRGLFVGDIPEPSERGALFKNDPYSEAIARLHTTLERNKSRGAEVGAAMDVLERKWNDFHSCPRSQWERRFSQMIRSQHPRCIPEIRKILEADKTLLNKRTDCEKRLDDLVQVDPEDAETNRRIYHYLTVIKNLSRDMIMEARNKLKTPTRDEIRRMEASAAALSSDGDENPHSSKGYEKVRTYLTLSDQLQVLSRVHKGKFSKTLLEYILNCFWRGKSTSYIVAALRAEAMPVLAHEPNNWRRMLIAKAVEVEKIMKWNDESD